LLPGWGPGKIVRDGAAIKQMELVQCTSVFDDSGAFCPMFGSDKLTVDADQVILAIGQSINLDFAAGKTEPEVVAGMIKADPDTQATSAAGLYAGGDAATKAPGTPGTIIEAIAAGRRAASAIDQALGGNGDIDEQLWTGTPPDAALYEGRREAGFATVPRVEYAKLPVEERKGNFNEVGKCFAEEEAVAEANRCLHCDLELKLALNGFGPAA